MEKEWIINELPAKTWNWLKMNESQVTAVTDAIPCIPQVGVETSDNSNGKLPEGVSFEKREIKKGIKTGM